jgi:hypothetical protein
MKVKLSVILILTNLLLLQRVEAREYEFGGCFSIDVPENLELRSDSDVYTKFQDSIGHYQSVPIVFQQKGLGRMDSVAFNSFCRILINGTRGNQGDFFYSNQKDISEEELINIQSELQELCDINKSDYFDYIYEQTFDWIEINPNCYAYRATYVREGLHGDVMTKLYFLQNSCEALCVSMSYRISLSEEWSNTLDSAIHSFRWINPHYAPQDSINSWLVGLFVACTILVICLVAFIISIKK